MAKMVPITEHFQHFLAEMKEGLWGDVYGETKVAGKPLIRFLAHLHRQASFEVV